MTINIATRLFALALALGALACSHEEPAGSRVKVEGGTAEEAAAGGAAAEATALGEAEKSLANTPVHEGQLRWERFERRPNGQSFLAYKCTDMSSGGQIFVLRLTRQGGIDMNETLNRRCASYLCYLDSVNRSHVLAGESRSTYQKCGVQGSYTRQ